MRLAICRIDNIRAIGLVDIFDFDPKNNRAGVGIVIQHQEDRNTGVGAEALELLIRYSFRQLQLHQLYANIGADNNASLALFAKFGFEKIGIKKQWNLVDGKYQDEILFQLINPKI